MARGQSRSTPLEIAELVSELSPQQATLKPTPEEFSALENICHLRDIEIEGYAVRIRKILNEEQPSLPDIDGSRLAIERDYNRQNIQEALEAFMSARKRNVEVLSAIDESHLGRSGELEGTGSITLLRC